jgi:hypothetical protein
MRRGLLSVTAPPACQTRYVPTLTDLAWLAVMVAMMALVVAFALWRTRQIRDGRADPVIAPDWTSIERPASPPSAIRWGLDNRPEVEDDHVGRPFPVAEPHRVGDLSGDHRDRGTSH